MVTSPNQYHVHGACLLANAIFGLGSIVGALGLPATNPLAFTFVREICSGTLLLLLAHFANDDGSRDKLVPAGRTDALAFLQIGFLLFLNQAGYIVGLGLAGAVTGSVWQPSCPVFTAAIAMLLRLEDWNGRRFAGVLVAFGGCATMVLLSDRAGDAIRGGGTSFAVGNAMFCMNCTSVAGFVLLSKRVLGRYPALMVTAWSYYVACIFMFLAALVSSRVEAIETIICPSCPPDQSTFAISRGTIPALTYYIAFQSVAAWGLTLWANQYATGTLVVGYTVLQPVTAILFTTLFLATGWVASCNAAGEATPCLNEPGLGTLCGMLGVACGLTLVVWTEPTAREGAEESTRTKATDYGSMTPEKGRLQDGWL